MYIKSIAGVVFGAVLSHSAAVNASVLFYTDKSIFDAASNTSLINFETFVDENDNVVVVGDNELFQEPAFVIDGMTFTTDTAPTKNAWICGKDRCGNGTDSALFIAAGSSAAPANIIIDLSLTGSSVTAAGGIFGDLDGPPGSGRFDVYNGSTLLDSFNVTFGDMSVGQPKTFFGWTATGADEITKIDFIADVAYSALDDFQYGAVVPVPAAFWLFSSGLLGLIGFARRKR